jgi:hypothetical protein
MEINYYKLSNTARSAEFNTEAKRLQWNCTTKVERSIKK